MDFAIDINQIRSAIMVLLFVCFIAIGLWAYQGKRKAQFTDAANLPFDDEVNHVNTFTVIAHQDEVESDRTQRPSAQTRTKGGDNL